jgi:hypothetical protein
MTDYEDEFNIIDTTVVKAIRIGKNREVKVYTTAKNAAHRYSQLSTHSFLARNPSADPMDDTRRQRLYDKVLPLFERLLK